MLTDFNNSLTAASRNNVRKNRAIIYHPPSNLLPYYLERSKCLTLQVYKKLFKLKLCKIVYSQLTSIRVVTFLIIYLCRLPLRVQFYIICWKMSAAHIWNRGSHWWIDASMTYCSVLCQTFSGLTLDYSDTVKGAQKKLLSQKPYQTKIHATPSFWNEIVIHREYALTVV